MRRLRLSALVTLLAAAAAVWSWAGASVGNAQSSAAPPRPSPPPMIRPQPPPQVVPAPLRQTPQRVVPESREGGTAAQPRRTQRRPAQPAQSTPSAPRRPAPSAASEMADAPLPRARPTPLGSDAPLPPLRPQPFEFDPAQRDPDIVLIALEPGTADAMVQAIAADHDLTVLEQTTLGLVQRLILRLRIDDDRTIDEVLAGLGGDVRLAFGQPNHIFALQGSFGHGSIQYAAAKLRLDEAHALAVGRGVTVALIDTGIDPGHEAFQSARIRVSTVLGTEAPAPGAHGTEMAGAIVAQGMLRGVAPEVDLVAIETFVAAPDGARGHATTFEIAKALDQAHQEAVDIVSMSFAGGPDALLGEMLDALEASGTVIVAAAGNGGPAAPPAFPAAHDKTIAVTATNVADQLYDRANRGDYISLAAPGVEVISPTPADRYRMVTGTSIAAAHVAGAVALLLEHRPNLTPEEVRALLRESAVDLGSPGPDPEYGAGLIDLIAVLQIAGERVATPGTATAAD